jgi:hypothetical protein
VTSKASSVGGALAESWKALLGGLPIPKPSLARSDPSTAVGWQSPSQLEVGMADVPRKCKTVIHDRD